ncbi:hypothetical protein EIP86_005069 [Pleurotus ostreatoroseus]|nr:hypothetical protein EIP86_005069 [Pleurotus ostreatoroseus]
MQAPLVPIPPGFGKIELRSGIGHATLSQLVSSYPLKLLSPRIPYPIVAVVYVLTYGGGLVAGDHVSLDASVHDGTILVLLTQVYSPSQALFTQSLITSNTQGSTKVFKTRPRGRQARPSVSGSPHASIDPSITSQTLDVRVEPDSALFLLPDPVSCFRAASYTQRQTVHLADPSASTVLLDWVTAGRAALGEAWSFARYYSLNELFVGGRRVARDALLLEEYDPPSHAMDGLRERTLADRLAPYACYATAILYGPHTDATRRALQGEFEKDVVFRRSRPPELVWSFTALDGGKGGILRVAAVETESVRDWLKIRLKGLAEVVGQDVYKNAFG